MYTKEREIFIGVSKDTNLSCSGASGTGYLNGGSFIELNIEMLNVSIYIKKDENMKQYAEFLNVRKHEDIDLLREFAIETYFMNSKNYEILEDIQNAHTIEFKRGIDFGKNIKQNEFKKVLGL